MKKEKFYELIRAVQNASKGKLGKISPEIRDNMHQLYESFKEEIEDNIKVSGYNDQTYIYLAGLIFDLSGRKHNTPSFKDIFKVNTTTHVVQSSNEQEQKTIQTQSQTSPNLFNHAFNQIELLINHHIDTCRVVAHFPLHKQVHGFSGKKDIAPFNWNMSQTDFIELSFSLVQIGAIIKSDGSKITTKELIEHFSERLDYRVHSWESKISKARHRKKGCSQFLSNLQLAFSCPKKQDILR